MVNDNDRKGARSEELSILLKNAAASPALYRDASDVSVLPLAFPQIFALRSCWPESECLMSEVRIVGAAQISVALFEEQNRFFQQTSSGLTFRAGTYVCKDFPENASAPVCHVLEHVVDDQKAMRELLRVLRAGGWGVMQSPINRQRVKTFEDPTIVSPRDRERAFGQHNHLRLYGRDYEERLQNAGFTVKVDTYVADLEEHLVKKYGLQEEEVYFCTKEERNIQFSLS